MRLIGLMLTRNSDWIIGASARAALGWCDGLVILAHACTDRTVELAQEIAGEHPGRVMVLVEDSPVWDEMDHRQRTLAAARELGATHVANVDDDEIVTANVETVLREAAAKMAPGDCLTLPWISMWGGLDGYRDDDSHWSRSQVDVVFADCSGMHYKAACDGYQHHARRPKGNGGQVHRPVPTQAEGGLMHFQFASPRRLKAKQALYQLNELLRWPGRMSREQIRAMYDGTTLAPNLRLSAAPPAWWAGLEHLHEHIQLDAEPWQEVEVRRLVHEYGKSHFDGLNFYGIL